jgi:hypothetical protein
MVLPKLYFNKLFFISQIKEKKCLEGQTLELGLVLVEYESTSLIMVNL